MKRRTFIKSGAAAASGAIIMGAPSLALAATSLKFDSYVSDSAGPSWVDRWYLDELEKRTEGEVTIRRYWSGSLNKVGEHLSAVRDGTSEMTLIAPGYYESELPVTRGLDWYFRMNRADALQQVCRDNGNDPFHHDWRSYFQLFSDIDPSAQSTFAGSGSIWPVTLSDHCAATAGFYTPWHVS